MTETEGRTVVRDARVEGACPACGGPVEARTSGEVTWLVCGECRLISQSHVLPGENGRAVLVHHVAAA